MERTAQSVLRELRACGQRGKPDVVHSFGIWLPFNHAVSRAARLTNRPLVISPLGMLEPWALEHQRRKKRLAWRAFQRKDLTRAAVLHTTSDSEAENVRGLGLGVPVAMIPHGVGIPGGPVRQLRTGSGPRKALFLSRIHPKKGLLDLVSAWASLRPAGWHMVVAGPDEGGHQREVERAAQDHGLWDVFDFRGPVYGEAKEALWNEADLFILPTHSENFGHVVGEALARGLPVITTHGAPWHLLEEESCGWWVPTGSHAIAAALAKALALDDVKRYEMGQRGRSVAIGRFSWSAAAEKYVALYRWIAGRGARPEFVE